MVANPEEKKVEEVVVEPPKAEVPAAEVEIPAEELEQLLGEAGQPQEEAPAGAELPAPDRVALRKQRTWGERFWDAVVRFVKWLFGRS